MEKPERKWNSHRDRRAAEGESAERFVCVSVQTPLWDLLEPYRGGASIREQNKKTSFSSEGV